MGPVRISSIILLLPDQHAPKSRSCLCAVSEDIIKATADIMVDSGLKKAGYEYLVIDGMSLHNLLAASNYLLGACLEEYVVFCLKRFFVQKTDGPN